MPIITNPLGEIAAAVFDNVKNKLGVAQASRWMFTGNDSLDGRSPIQAIKEGKAGAVWTAAAHANDELHELLENTAAKPNTGERR